MKVTGRISIYSSALFLKLSEEFTCRILNWRFLGVCLSPSPPAQLLSCQKLSSNKININLIIQISISRGNKPVKLHQAEWQEMKERLSIHQILMLQMKTQNITEKCTSTYRCTYSHLLAGDLKDSCTCMSFQCSWLAMIMMMMWER